MQENQPDTFEESSGGIPMWVALAGLVVAFIVAIIIMANVLEPLVNLIFPGEAEIPLPPNMVELEHIESPRTSDGEWLYGSEMHICEAASFFIEAGGNCRFPPFSCEAVEGGTGVSAPVEGTNQNAVITCTGGSDSIMNSYRWEALIGVGNEEYQSRIRVYLYSER